MNNNDKLIKVAITIIIALLTLFLIIKIGFGGFTPKNPYEDKEGEQEYGEIEEVDDDEQEGDKDLSKNQVIDSNKITYLRRNIPVLKSSMLVPQGWEIKETDTQVFFIPPEDSDLAKIQVGMYIESSYGNRKPEDLNDFFEDFKKDGFFYKNGNYTLVPAGMKVTNKEMLYDRNAKTYIHKKREGLFEQLPSVPEGLNKEDFVEQDRFVGIAEDVDMSMFDQSNRSVTGNTKVRFFQTFTGNNKSVLMHFTAPKNFELEMHEIARVMSYSMKDIHVMPASKSNAEPIKREVDLGSYTFRVPETFNNEVSTENFYMARAYNSIFDDAYGINFYIKRMGDLFSTDDPIIKRYDLDSEEIQEEIKKEIINYVYDDDRTIIVPGEEDVIDLHLTSNEKVSYGGYEGIEQVYIIRDNDNPSYSRSQTKKSLPIHAIVTVIDYKSEPVIAITTYDNHNYELSEVYNKSILRSLTKK